MDTAWLLGLCLLFTIGLETVAVLTPEQKIAMVKYEAAVSEKMAELRANAKKGEEQQDEMKKALDSVAHLKPDDLAVEDMIAMMGRLFQSQLGLNIQVKGQDELDKDALERKEAEKKEAEKKEKKKDKKKKKKTKKRPSMSHSDEL